MGVAEGVGHGSRLCRLRGLPYSATQEDISKFFDGYVLYEVYLCKRDGRSTGEAYVVFDSPSQASSALEKLDKQYMGSRYIELFEAADADLAAVKHVLEDERLQGCVVRLRGLPYTATAADVALFFEGIKLAEGNDAIVFTQTVDGRPTGEAYVELADQDAHTAAMTRHKEVMSNRYIEVFHSSRINKLQALQQQMCMPDAAFSRWKGHTVPQDVVATAATAAGMRVVPCARMPTNKPLGYAVDQLASSLQGVHLTNSLPMSPAANLVHTPRQFRLAACATPNQPLSQQVLIQQQQQQQVVAAAAQASSISGLPPTTAALSSGLVSTACSMAGSAVAPVSTTTANMQQQQPGMMSPGGNVQQVAFVQQPYQHQYQYKEQHTNPMGVQSVPPYVQGAPQMVLGPDGQALGPAVYYPVHPMQQGMLAAPYSVPAYSMQGPPVPSGPPEQHALMTGAMRPLLVGGAQWLPVPAWPQPCHPDSSRPMAIAAAGLKGTLG